ncbi:DNA invertase [Agathobacter rectalis]|jgi:site-specific DNA recombinase|uniref:DNA invertase n=1 Tax=Agathobacter rectalis TaxID=39491 RepID=A0A414HYS0_9FIRM|nr:recombinase family protein [Agathobacter rectalis]RGW41410.1 DNA invertase [Agathobacter rectalis]RHD94691.1 DNA invertase [Agathobacter rectalis]
MGRVSKRKAVEKQFVVNSSVRRYRAGIYARLSSDQDIKKNESVEVQIEIARKFVEEFNQKNTGEVIDVVECYTDLGKTGSNFEREGFQRLLQEIRLGEINCVIVKDLSRFGRNYLEAGNYIEKIFPFLGVRFIAVADGFDTGKEGNENKQMASEIKNLVNDMYAKDFSKKAKIHLKQRREEGSYVGGPPPYGYISSWNDKRRVLIPDDNTAVIVKFIYERFVETESYAVVADLLNRRKINPPAIYKKTKEVYHSSDEKEYKGWDKSAVERILKSDTYSGTLVQGKTSITAKNERNRIHKSEEEWVVTKDAHESLISMELYRKAKEIQEKIAQKTASHKNHTKGYPIEENIFDSVLYCGVCGRKMTRTSYVKEYADGGKARLDGYFCLNGGQTKVTVCPESNRISKAELVDILRPLIRMEFAVFLDKPKKYVEFGNERISESVKRAEAKLHETEVKIRRFREEESSVYMDYRAGKILQKDYVAYKMQQEDKLIELRKVEEGQKKDIKTLEKLSGRYLSAIRALLKLKSGKELTKDMVEAFISKIYVYPGKRIEVLFTFTADCMEGVK